MEPEKPWLPKAQDVLAVAPIFINRFVAHRNADEVRISVYEALPGTEPVLRTALVMTFANAEAFAGLLTQVIRTPTETKN